MAGKRFKAGFGLMVLAALTASAAWGVQETVLHDFGGKGDGRFPVGALVPGPDGNLYGLASHGGIYGPGAVCCVGTAYTGGGYGLVYRLTPRGRYSHFYNFQGALAQSNGGYATDGLVPLFLTLGPDGLLYGTTQFGNPDASKVRLNRGTLFSLTLNGQETVLHHYGNGADKLPTPASPDAPLSLVYDDDGDFYATGWQYQNEYGDPSATSFLRVAPDGTTTTVAAATNAMPPLLPVPPGGFVGEYGNAIVKVSTAGSFTTLYTFAKATAGDPDSGQTPVGGLVQGTDGNYYGITMHLANGDFGTMFSLTPSGQLTTLQTFRGAPTDGAQPTSLMAGGNGIFYGTTCQGGANNKGAVFAVTPGGVGTILYSFTGGPDDGQCPNSPLLYYRGQLYGTTSSGGAYNAGTIYRITPP